MPATELPVLVLTEGLTTLLPESARRGAAASTVRRTLQQLEQEVLPEFLRPRGWFTRHMGDACFRQLGARTSVAQRAEGVPARATSKRVGRGRRATTSCR